MKVFYLEIGPMTFQVELRQQSGVALLKSCSVSIARENLSNLLSAGFLRDVLRLLHDASEFHPES